MHEIYKLKTLAFCSCMKDHALGHIKSNAAPLLVPLELPNRCGVAVMLYARRQVPPLHVLKHQHGEARVHAGPIELDHVGIKRQHAQQAEFLQYTN